MNEQRVRTDEFVEAEKIYYDDNTLCCSIYLAYGRKKRLVGIKYCYSDGTQQLYRLVRRRERIYLKSTEYCTSWEIPLHISDQAGDILPEIQQ